MTWFRLDDTWLMHPRIRAAGLKGRALWIAGGLHCSQHLTDGRIDKSMVPILAAQAEVPPSTAGTLLDLELWVDDGDAYLMAGFLDYNPAREKVERDRARWARNKRKSREVSTEDTREDSTGESRRPVPSRPPTEGFTNNSSSPDGADLDDEWAQLLGEQDHAEAIARGTPMTDPEAHRRACIQRRRDEMGQSLVPAENPVLVIDPHAGCGPECDHGWLHPNGPDGGAARCPGTPA